MRTDDEWRGARAQRARRAKLLWAGLNLDASDLATSRTARNGYPVELVRALAVAWLFGGLRRLLRECRSGRVGTVVIPSIDRLSRDVRLAENLFHEFGQLGVQVLIADMQTYNGKDRTDALIRQISEAIAEENRKDIIERLWRGRQERVRRGLPPGGNVPYGYRRNVEPAGTPNTGELGGPRTARKEHL